MAAKTGSDELFRLIHSLSAEEKGYFKKFAGRYTQRENVYLKLFEAINKQKHFEETSLKRIFAKTDFKDLKLYLKDMITDAMVLYYKSNHPHIRLLNQLQKIHLLTIKGFSKEALKVIEKALKQSTQMELFDITGYLLRMQVDISTSLLSRIENVEETTANYRLKIKEAIEGETNLVDNEFLNIDWFIASKKHNKSNGPVKHEVEKAAVSAFPANSLRAQMEKLNALKSIFNIEGNAIARYQVTKEAMLIAEQFRKLHDSSFNTVPPISNHIVSCNMLGKYDEIRELCDKLIGDETNIEMYNNMAFSNVNFIRIALYYRDGDFGKGLAEIQGARIAPMLDLLKSKSSVVALGFQELKIVLLFATGKYQECWIALQEMRGELKKDKSTIASIMMLEMMIQIEMGNLRSLPAMAKRAEKELSSPKLMKDHYRVLLNFFKDTSTHNIKKNAALTLTQLKKLQIDGNTALPPIFGFGRYDHWLETKCTTKTLAQLTTDANVATQ